MFASAAAWYVYLCYGIHELLNLTTGPVGYPAAILIRGLDGIVGPGRLTKKLGIDRRFNGLTASPETGLWIEDRGIAVANGDVETTPRIGVDYAGKIGRIDLIDSFGEKSDRILAYSDRATTESLFRSNDSSLIEAVPMEVLRSSLRGILRWSLEIQMAIFPPSRKILLWGKAEMGSMR